MQECEDKNPSLTAEVSLQGGKMLVAIFNREFVYAFYQ